MSAFLRRYATATVAATHVRVPLIVAGGTDFATNSDWTPQAGDVQISKDGGSLSNIGTLPTYTNGFWEFQFTSAELTAANIVVSIVDSATKAVEDDAFVVETYGNVSALHTTENMSGSITKGQAQTGTLSTTQMTTDLTEATNDHYNGKTLIFMSGNLLGQATSVTDYDGGTKMLTYIAITEAPTNGDDFVLV